VGVGAVEPNKFWVVPIDPSACSDRFHWTQWATPSPLTPVSVDGSTCKTDRKSALGSKRTASLIDDIVTMS
jgi:hypothetical protein